MKLPPRHSYQVSMCFIPYWLRLGLSRGGAIPDLSPRAIVLSGGAGSSHHPPPWPTLSRAGPPARAQLEGWRERGAGQLDVSFHPESFIIRKDINRLIKSQQWSRADSWRRECDQTDPYQSAEAASLYVCVCVLLLCCTTVCVR